MKENVELLFWKIAQYSEINGMVASTSPNIFILEKQNKTKAIKKQTKPKKCLQVLFH